MTQEATISARRWVGSKTTYPDLTECRAAEGGRRLKGDSKKSRPGAPLVTILTVCWNSAKTIEQTIESVLDQTYPNIEYLVVDGASSDATLDIIRKYEDRIDYYVSEPDDGLYYAMNKGLELAKGDYILILNSDDWYERDAVEALVDAKDYSGCDFVAALARYVDEETGETKVLRSMPFDHSQYLRMSIRHETMLLPASLYDRLGPYDTSYRILSDREYAARLLENDCTFYELPQALLNFRTGGISNTDTASLQKEKDLLLSKHFPFLSEDECAELNATTSANPDAFVRIANRHLDAPKFVKACRDLLADRKANQPAKWGYADITAIGASPTETLPRISVILPFYAAENSIGDSIDSVLGQSLKELELICVNDCAIDGSEAVVRDYCTRDSRVKLISNDRNIGLGASRNAGVRAANGHYIFHLDPDDTLPENALARLYETARKHDSVLTRGAFEAEQSLHGRANRRVVKYPCGINNRIVANANLSKTPELLNSTEGHWAFLYDASLARQVPYPTDLKMGQDSIFLVNALCRARSVTLIPDVIYHYQENADSAMNRFNAQKFFDALEWRLRAWHVLKDFDLRERGECLLFNYWGVSFFEALEKQLSGEEYRSFFQKMADAFTIAGYNGPAAFRNDKAREKILAGFDKAGVKIANKSKPETRATVAENTLKIATFSTRDHGGAGQGSQRRVEALRRRGVDAEIHCLFKKTDKSHVKRIRLSQDDAGNESALADAWRDCAVLRKQHHPQLKARELFSKPESLVDFQQVDPIFARADVVHFHWVVGMFDYAGAPKYLADKPVVWTLADMNAFTGGCHYSEGCEGYKRDCRNCPLLGENDALAHEHWKIKKAAYDGMKNLHVICPSQWLADRVRESALLGDRPIHVIPNALPVDRFQATNKIVARTRLGLPLNKKLVVFGADSLKNIRKGGDILRSAIGRLRTRKKLQNVEGLFFGASSLDLGIKTHNMGHVSDERRLSLIFAAADVFAFPSREDNAPLTVAESMLSGTPVVAFPVGNIPDLITHRETGYIANYLDIDDFAAGLEWALAAARAPEAIARSVRCRLDAAAYNDPQQAAARHIELYNTLVSKKENPEKSLRKQ